MLSKDIQGIDGPWGPQGREPKWLDRHLSGRLSNHYRLPFHENSPALAGLLRFWQWQRLTSTLLAAASSSPAYQKRIGRQQAAAFIAQSAAEAGLDPALARTGPDDFFVGQSVSRPLAEAVYGLASGLEAALESALAALLARLPFTFPHELAEASEDFLSVSQGEVEGLISLPSSGTTGPGKRIYCTADDLGETAAFFCHGMQYLVRPGQNGGGKEAGAGSGRIVSPGSGDACDNKPGKGFGGPAGGVDRPDSVALLMSGERPGSVGDLLSRGLAELGVACFVPGFIRPESGGAQAMIETLLRLEPTCLVGVPGQLLALARHERAPELAPLIRKVLLSGDAVTPEMRLGIARGLGCEVFVHYGLTETGLGGAVECSLHQGCHVRAADLLVEIVDERGKALPRGSYGEIVLTTLTRRAMPLLRYRTGDEGRLAARGCGCGSVLPLLEVRGRMAERIALPGGGHLHLTDIDRCLYALPWVRAYTATLHEEAPDRAACLRLVVETTPDAPEQAAGQVAAVVGRLEGVRVLAGGQQAGRGIAALPVRISLSRKGEKPAHSQAKQVIRRTHEPCPLL